MELIATGEPVDAPRALALGLVNRVVPPDQLMPEALRVAALAAANAPLAVAWSLEVARRAQDVDEAELRRHAHEIALRVVQTDDSREGPRAFAERRLPVWRGR